MEKNKYPYILPTSGKAKKLVVFLHGLGSNGHDLISLSAYLKDIFPDIYFISPNGLDNYVNQENSYQWFSLEDRELVVLQRELSRVTPAVLAIIESQLKTLDLTWGDVILVGFSQGAMLSLYLSLIQAQRFHSTIAFSGSLIIPTILPNYLNKTPICLVHGKMDNIVPYEDMIFAQKKLETLNFDVEAHELDNLAHSIDHRGVELLKSFIKKHI